MTDGWHNQNGGAIRLLSGALTLNNCIVSSSHSRNEGGAIDGQNGHIAINNSTFSANSSYGNGGAISFSATSSDEQWSVQITGSTFDRNSTEGEGIAGSVGGEGGAIYLNGGNVSISASSFSRNTASKQGGAILNDAKIDTPSFSRLKVTNSTFFGNVAPLGAAIDLESGSNTELTHLTIAGNTAFPESAALTIAGHWRSATASSLSRSRALIA